MMQPTDSPSDLPLPTDHDRENARRRLEIAERQAAEYDQVARWALGKFGPGWLPSHRHFLLDKSDEDRLRYSGERPTPAATVYTIKHAGARRRHFTVADGVATEHESMEAGFGPMLLEPHPTSGFTDKAGQFHHYHRYSLCWSPFERYTPKTAEQLAALRVTRERNKAEREAREFAEEFPLFALIEKAEKEEGRGR